MADNKTKDIFAELEELSKQRRTGQTGPTGTATRESFVMPELPPKEPTKSPPKPGQPKDIFEELRSLPGAKVTGKGEAPEEVPQAQPQWKGKTRPLDQPLTEEEIGEGAWHENWISEKPLQKKEFDYVVKAYGLNEAEAERLREHVPMAGLRPAPDLAKQDILENIGETLKFGAGAISKGALFNLPQKAMRESEDVSDRLAAAMSHLEEMGDPRMSWLLWTLTNVAAPTGLAKQGVKVGTKISEPAVKAAKEFLDKGALQSALGWGAAGGVSGATFGVGSSRRGKEEEGALMGLALGIALGGGIGGASRKLFGSSQKATENALEDVTKEASLAAIKEAKESAPKEADQVARLFTDDIDEALRSPEFNKKLEQDISKAMKVARDSDFTKKEELLQEELEALMKDTRSTTEEMLWLKRDANQLGPLQEKADSLLERITQNRAPHKDNIAAYDKLNRKVLNVTNGKKLDDFIIEGKAVSSELKSVLYEHEARRLFKKIAPDVAEQMASQTKLNRIARTVVDGLPLMKVISQRAKMDGVTPLENLSAGLSKLQGAEIKALDIVGKMKKGKLTENEAMEAVTKLLKDEFGVEPPVKVDNYLQEMAIRKPFLDWSSSAILEAEKLGVTFTPLKKEKAFTLPWTKPAGPKWDWKVTMPESMDEEAAARLAKELQMFTQEKDLAKSLTKIRNMDRGDIADSLDINNRYLAKRDTADIPDWAREEDPARKLLTYVGSVGRTEATREPIARLKNIASLLGPGDRNAAEWVANLADDVMGRPRQGVRKIGDAGEGFLASDKTTRLYGQQRALLDRAIVLKRELAKENPDEKAIRKAVGQMTKGQWSPHVSGLIYANTLARPKTALANLISPYTVAMPWLGAHLGGPVSGPAKAFVLMSRATGEAMYDFMKAFAKRGKMDDTNLLAETYQRGLTPQQFTGEQYQQLRDGVRASLIEAAQKRGYDTTRRRTAAMIDTAANFYSRTLLSAFSASEKVARMTSLSTAKKLAPELMSNEKMQKSFLDSVTDDATRNRFIRALNDGDEDELTTILARYVNRETMFNYDRANLNELGRTAGPWISMFSKWPAKQGGDIWAEVAINGMSKGMSKNVQKLVLPYAILAGSGYVAREHMMGKDSYEGRLYDTLIGDLGSKAAFSSFLDLRKMGEEGIKTPIMQVIGTLGGLLGSAAESAKNQDLKVLGKSGTVLNTYLGIGGAQNLADDLSIIFTGTPIREKKKRRKR